MRIAVVCLVSLVVAVGLVHSLPVNPSSSQEGASQGDTLVRDKRTVGFLRDLFPNFSQMIDRKIQMLTRLIFRVIGRLVLQGGGGGGGGGGSDTEERRISITLPTYPPSEDDEDEDEDEDTEAPAAADSDSAASELTTTIKSEDADEDNSVAESKVSSVRVKREDGESDLNVEATGDNNEVSDDTSDAESEEDEDEDPRNKRFLNFNLGGTADASSGGSGNFLFDIIRLVAGSGSTQETDESSHAAVEEPKDEGSYGFGVPGPLTRLFVIANRGVASLIQDLILRLAQTSERIVNFKARLITSII